MCKQYMCVVYSFKRHMCLITSSFIKCRILSSQPGKTLMTAILNYWSNFCNLNY